MLWRRINEVIIDINDETDSNVNPQIDAENLCVTDPLLLLGDGQCKCQVQRYEWNVLKELKFMGANGQFVSLMGHHKPWDMIYWIF